MWRGWPSVCPGARRRRWPSASSRWPTHAGADTVQIGFNRGAMPQEMFLEQIRRFARDVLPIVQAHQVTRVPAADEVTA